jgi:hypothetical protein
VAERNACETVLWSTPEGVRCVVVAYDETRYQLKLLRPQGTIKADLFSGYTATLAAAEDWRRQITPQHSRSNLPCEQTARV